MEHAVLGSIRRIGTDPNLADAVAAEVIDQMARKRAGLDWSGIRNAGVSGGSTKALPARPLTPASIPTHGSNGSMALPRGIQTTENRLTDLAAERKSDDQDRINANDLRTMLAEFDLIWSSLITRTADQSP
jgi:hypothetical protein